MDAHATKRLSSVDVPEAQGPRGKGRGYVDRRRRHEMDTVPEGADRQPCAGRCTMSATIRRGTLSKAETAARTRQGRQPE